MIKGKKNINLKYFVGVNPSEVRYGGPPLRSTVVRASARGAGGRGSIPDRVTPKT